MTPQEVIEMLALEPLPHEGGFFRETYRSALTVESEALLPLYQGSRSLSTAIFYLLTPDTFSALHRLPGDEVYHFYIGDPVQLLMLMEDGSTHRVTLGTDLLSGAVPQHLVPGGCWQGSRLADGGSFALMGTTMAPGFEFTDFELGDVVRLTESYPSEADLIRALLVAD